MQGNKVADPEKCEKSTQKYLVQYTFLPTYSTYSSIFLEEKNYPLFVKSTQTSAVVSSLLDNGDINPKGREMLL